MRPALRQEKGQCVFFWSLIFSVFSYLLPQKFVDLSNQMYIGAETPGWHSKICGQKIFSQNVQLFPPNLV
ncbi:hypothetical protein TS65_23575 [Aneurinibacillus migulanus]|uniref:Uncharacterized protein n=1 Tax=Aneurinibacillus migulanus TaxID=47500 RepID=A0A0D1XJF9_ANEMI|nr:hypothetical protein TS65_23575 [Aneurinibacillus migulanus]KON94572.1 hypothetical protein AF333_02750 [Aneurinibacillus migulanus]